MSAGEQRVRLFVSLSVPAEVRSTFAIVQEDLRAQLSPRAASWTRLENIHLTLRFLGDVDSTSVEALSSALATVAANFESLPLVAAALAVFRICAIRASSGLGSTTRTNGKSLRNYTDASLTRLLASPASRLRDDLSAT